MDPQPKPSTMFSFYEYPNFQFEDQIESEKIILLVRAHPITQLPWVINAFGLTIVLILLNLFLPGFIAFNQLIFINLFGITVIGSYLFYNFLSWYFNVGIITNERIVDVDFYNVLYKEVTATRIEKIEDVTSKSGGFIESFFHYGDVFVQTAGNELNIEFLEVPSPSRIVRIINDLMET